MQTEASVILELLKHEKNGELSDIIAKVTADNEITPDDAMVLYTSASLPLLSCLSTIIRQRRNGNNVYYIRNYHIEPSNICVFSCKFCSYSHKCSESQWDLRIENIIEKVKTLPEGTKELHITGSAHPDKKIDFYLNIATAVKKAAPHIHLKAFSAVELDYIFQKSNLSYDEGIKAIKSAGVDSIPGGGAEIFDEIIRKEICPDKITSSAWLEMHRIAHNNGLTSNATMLYGHIENYRHRIDHMQRLRKLQDETGGFNCFIPLKFRNSHNLMNKISESILIEDLKNYAVSRIFLNNFPHIKAYRPAIGLDAALLAMSFGADDIDGITIDSTSIYSMAGSSEENTTESIEAMRRAIKSAGFIPIERDSIYKHCNG